MFINELENELKKIGSLTLNYDIFKNVCMDAINKHELLKRKYIRTNQAIMKRSKFRNDYLKHRSEENILAYKRQRNFCVTLLGKKKADYSNNIDLNLV